MARGFIASGVRSSDRAEFEEFRRQFEAEEQQKRDAAERPLREAEASFQKTAAQLAQAERDALLTTRDPEVYVDPRTVGKVVSMDTAAEVTGLGGEEFVKRHPEFYQCPENADLFVRYFTANGLKICTLEMYEAAYKRLYPYLLQEPQAPAVEQPVETQPLQSVEAQPETVGYSGVDIATGQPRVYTAYEVESMSSDAYRKAFRIPTKWQAEMEDNGGFWR